MQLGKTGPQTGGEGRFAPWELQEVVQARPFLAGPGPLLGFTFAAKFSLKGQVVNIFWLAGPMPTKVAPGCHLLRPYTPSSPSQAAFCATNGTS